MKTVTQRPSYQGDVMLRRIDSVPPDATEATPGTELVIAHSETGHHHVIDPPDAAILMTGPDPLVSYLRVLTGKTAAALHLRDFDTHEPMRLPEGCYEIRRQVEFAPEGWRVVAD